VRKNSRTSSLKADSSVVKRRSIGECYPVVRLCCHALTQRPCKRRQCQRRRDRRCGEERAMDPDDAAERGQYDRVQEAAEEVECGEYSERTAAYECIGSLGHNVIDIGCGKTYKHSHESRAENGSYGGVAEAE